MVSGGVAAHAGGAARDGVKILLLAVAFGAAWVAARKPADILFMVSAAFSFAASSFFPALVMGVFWRRANKWGRRWAWRRGCWSRSPT